MPARIRIRTDRISADLAAQRLQQEGVPAQLVGDDDALIAGSGVPMRYSVVVPSQHEERARQVLAEVPRTDRGR